MIKMKKLLVEGEFNYNRKFGEPLPTLKSFEDKHQNKSTDESVTEETINEAPEQQMASQLNKISDTILKITNKFKGKADVDGMTRSWMLGLHAKLKKAGIKT